MKSIQIEGVSHGSAPIPMAAQVGPLLMSGGISGKDPESNAVADTPAEQAALVFQHVAAIISAAGGTVSDIVKMTFYVSDRDIRSHIDVHWLAMFPEHESRPARHTLVYEHLAPGVSMQCDFVAYIAAEAV